jgi:hydrogenase-1 operon protein HyaF
VGGVTGCVEALERTGMADAVMREVADELRAFGSDLSPRSIDLRSLPLTPADREELELRLGRGEVRIELDVAGRSEIWETAYAGVWWVRHRAADDQIVTESIDITRIPAVVSSHADDVRRAAARLHAELSGVTP